MRRSGSTSKERRADACRRRRTAKPGSRASSAGRTRDHAGAVVYGLAWGLVNYGFLVWLPVYVAKSNVSAGAVTTILAKAALFADPGLGPRRLALRPLVSRGTLVVAAGARGRRARRLRASTPAIVRHTACSPRSSSCCWSRCGRRLGARAVCLRDLPDRVPRRRLGHRRRRDEARRRACARRSRSCRGRRPASRARPCSRRSPPRLPRVLLLVVGIETRGRRLEEIARRPRQAQAEPLEHRLVAAPLRRRLHLQLQEDRMAEQRLDVRARARGRSRAPSSRPCRSGSASGSPSRCRRRTCTRFSSISTDLGGDRVRHLLLRQAQRLLAHELGDARLERHVGVGVRPGSRAAPRAAARSGRRAARRCRRRSSRSPDAARGSRRASRPSSSASRCARASAGRPC